MDFSSCCSPVPDYRRRLHLSSSFAGGSFQQQAVRLVDFPVSEGQHRQASVSLSWCLFCGQDGWGLCSGPRGLQHAPWVLYSFTSSPSSSLFTFSASTAASPTRRTSSGSQAAVRIPRSKQLPAAVHDVQHHIKTVGPPLASRFHRLEGAKLQAARAEFDQMEKDGIVRPSTSPWASPLHMVPKKDSSWQPRGIFGSSTL